MLPETKPECCLSAELYELVSDTYLCCQFWLVVLFVALPADN